MTNLPYGSLTVAHNSQPPVQLATSMVSDGPLMDIATTSVKMLSVVGFRGSVTFRANKTDGTPLWAAVVSFTDDLPNGDWLRTQYDNKGKAK